jgi:hypothetical protein
MNLEEEPLVEDNFDDLNDQAADDIGSSSGVRISSSVLSKSTLFATYCSLFDIIIDVSVYQYN